MAWTPRTRSTASAAVWLFAAVAAAQSDPAAAIEVLGATAGVHGSGPQPFVDRGSDVRVPQLEPGDYELDFAAMATGKPASLPLALADGAEATIAIGAPPDPDLLWRDDFSVPRPLQIDGDAASAWRVGSGRLWHDGGTAAARSNTVCGDPAWRDVAVSTRVSGDGRDCSFGVLFRRRDERNFGLFEWTAEHRVLTQVSDGVAEVLARDDLPFAPGRCYEISIVCRGAAVHVAIDRVPVMTATIGSASGACGLLASGKARVAFDELVVHSVGDDELRWQGGVGFEPQQFAAWSAAASPAGGDAMATWRPVGGELHKIAGAAAWTALATGDAERRAQRVDVDLQTGVGAAGIVLRWQDPEHHYRCVFDPGRSEVRLERLLGGQRFELGKASVQAAAGKWHHLSAQADGFRIAAWFDHAPVVQVLDGALTHGQAGVWAAGDSTATFARFAIGAPLPPLDVIAAVRSAGADGVEVQVVGRSPQHVGVDYVLALQLPRPGWPRLGDDRDLGPFLLLDDPHRVLPIGFAFGGKWDGVTGSIGARGEIEARLQWPARLAWSGRYVQLAGFVVSPDGEQLIDRLPPVWLRL